MQLFNQKDIQLLTAKSLKALSKMYAVLSSECAKLRLNQTTQYYQKLELPYFFNSYSP